MVGIVRIVETFPRGVVRDMNGCYGTRRRYTNELKPKGGAQPMYKRYMAQLDDIRAQVIADFDYWNGQQSAIDRRLNELGARGDIEAVANEMESLLQQRAVAKDTALKLLPLRDFYKNGWDEACERIERSESWNRN